jgi:hypothetical protein
MEGLETKYRLPLIDIAIPALKQLSLDQYRVFRGNLVVLIEMDSRVDLFEWCLQKILFNHLDAQFFKLERPIARYSRPGLLKPELELILSVMAYAGQQDKNASEAAFGAAAKLLEISGLQLVAKNDISLSRLDHAVKKLGQLKPLAKPQVLKACAASILHDRKITPVEVELLRAFADVFDCPMPPIIL